MYFIKSVLLLLLNMIGYLEVLVSNVSVLENLEFFLNIMFIFLKRIIFNF